jgi:hypothetical protein
MSLQAQPIPPIPELTAKVAHRAFRKGNVYMQMRDLLGTFFTDDQAVENLTIANVPRVISFDVLFLVVRLRLPLHLHRGTVGCQRPALPTRPLLQPGAGRVYGIGSGGESQPVSVRICRPNKRIRPKWKIYHVQFPKL